MEARNCDNRTCDGQTGRERKNSGNPPLQAQVRKSNLGRLGGTRLSRGHSGIARNSLALLLAALSLFQSCERRPAECGKYASFDRVPIVQRETDFRTHPVEEQLEIYICSWFGEPTGSGLADPIADQGERVIPLVVERLKRERREYSQKAIIYLLREMASRGYLRGRQDVLDEIRRTVSSMKHEYTRQSSQEWLNEIGRGG
jgi:hypothetical protein